MNHRHTIRPNPLAPRMLAAEANRSTIMNAIVGAAVQAWSFQWGTSAFLLLTAVLYFRGFARLHPQMPERFPRWRLGAFMAGTAALALALASPLEALDDRLLTTHMVQHLLLIFVAPPLLMMGAPAIPIIRALPPYVAKRTIGALVRSRGVRRFFRFATHPATTFAAFSVLMLGCHLPGPFQMALRSERLARGRACKLHHGGDALLVSNCAALARAGAMAAMGFGSLPAFSRCGEYGACRIHGFLRTVALSILCRRAADRRNLGHQ